MTPTDGLHLGSMPVGPAFTRQDLRARRVGSRARLGGGPASSAGRHGESGAAAHPTDAASAAGTGDRRGGRLPLERGAGLPSRQRRVRPGRIRDAGLGRMAPPHGVVDAGALAPHVAEAAVGGKNIPNSPCRKSAPCCGRCSRCGAGTKPKSSGGRTGVRNETDSPPNAIADAAPPNAAREVRSTNRRFSIGQPRWGRPAKRFRRLRFFKRRTFGSSDRAAFT